MSKKETKSRVIHIRVAPSKMEVLKKAKIKPAQFFRRSLDLFIERWKLKKYGEGSVEISLALVTGIKIDALEGEQKIILEALYQIRERLQKADFKSDLDRKFNLNLEKQFKEMLKQNKAKIIQCQNEYLQSLTEKQMLNIYAEINL